MAIEIIPFHEKYAQRFKELNTSWLKKYFYVEEKDTVLLDNSKAVIIDTGGYIFFAKYNTAIVGCFSFIKIDDTHYELGKMAVDSNFQGLGIGQELLRFALDFSKKQGWHKITLYSSTKLPHALYLYKKYGFVEIDLEKDLPYARSDIKMELLLHKTKSK
ncbi:GNAT family N-acetyltransferase [Costertonia aggregata]|uniref:GNAT family N-acetyltransferase n=1 Tax=Costertonia aggregata TaxID=343403 RepID=A0A7H9AUH5_9FLAO|nr:GNAT family N-acetyltransferase [Costertonia aggregata]QLG47143.1 GNAT family N-acetyltransferase [Costertonia aggregata]